MPWTKIIEYALLALLILGLGYWHNSDKNKAIEAVKISLSLKAEQEARAKEQIMNYDAYKLRAEKDDKIQTINSQLDSALRQLRNRPLRPSNPSAPSVGEACTGTKLYREDAEFLAREAARAESVKAERDYYYERYENARKSLAGEKQDAGHDGAPSDTKSVP